MVDWRHPKWLDLNKKAGDSFFGLTRYQARKLAYVFIFIGIILMDPPFSFIPTDFLNLGLATLIIKVVDISFTYALILTYTFVGFGLFMLGVWIFPYHTTSLINGYVNKLKYWLKRQSKNPIMIIIGSIIFYFIYKYYIKIMM